MFAGVEEWGLGKRMREKASGRKERGRARKRESYRDGESEMERERQSEMERELLQELSEPPPPPCMLGVCRAKSFHRCFGHQAQVSGGRKRVLKAAVELEVLLLRIPADFLS